MANPVGWLFDRIKSVGSRFPKGGSSQDMDWESLIEAEGQRLAGETPTFREGSQELLDYRSKQAAYDPLDNPMLQYPNPKYNEAEAPYLQENPTGRKLSPTHGTSEDTWITHGIPEESWEKTIPMSERSIQERLDWGYGEDKEGISGAQEDFSGWVDKREASKPLFERLDEISNFNVKDPDQVMAMQSRLKEAGYTDINIDGRFGPQTERYYRLYVNDLREGVGRESYRYDDNSPISLKDNSLWG